MKFCSAPLLLASMAAPASAFSSAPLLSSRTATASSSSSSLNNISNLSGAGAASQGPLDDDFLEKAPKVVKVQGETLKTFDFPNPNTQRVQIGARGQTGRPLHSRLEYWHTPTYVPFQVTAYSEDGLQRPIDCIIETPKHPKTIAMYNTASHQMPFDGAIYDTQFVSPYEALTKGPEGPAPSDIVQGGMIKYYNFDCDVEAIQVYIRSPEYNMKAKLELTTGPNSVRQTYEVYCSSGYKTPFYTVIQTPGTEASTLRIINQNSIEFPFDAYVLPYRVGDPMVGYGEEGLHWGEELPPRPPSNIMGQW
ncbi:MAG: hypothetical protein SGILL_007371 [Bacillariaceae sp.]